MVVPRFIQQALRNEPITVYGDGNQSRCFCDVSDVIRALVAGQNSDAIGQVYNVGNTEEVTITRLAQRVIALTGSKSEIRYIPYSEAYAVGFEDMQRRIPDTSRVRALLKWQPQIHLDGIIQRVAEYERTAQANMLNQG